MLAFTQSRAGNIALMFALVLPLLLGAAGGAIDYAHFHLKRQALQQVADKAALAGARQYVIADAEGKVPSNVARHVAQDGIAKADAMGAQEDVSADLEQATVTVDITYTFQPSFLVGMFKSPLGFKVTATAQARGSANVCVIALEPGGDHVIHLDDDASLSGNQCAVYANSTAPKALASKKNAMITAAQTCSAGGYEGGANNFNPSPTTDCPPREDPLATRTIPETPGGCDHTDRKVESSTTLAPGVYCKSLKIEKNATVTLQSGIYFIKDGMFEIKDNATVAGVGVGLVFVGDNPELHIVDDARVELQAPLSGDMAGVLLWLDPAATGPRKFLIKSPNVSKLVGTIYLPKGEFVGEIDAGGEIADASAYTAIIADKITLKKNSNLVLNSNYKATNVPVPEGIKASEGEVFLRD